LSPSIASSHLRDQRDLRRIALGDPLLARADHRRRHFAHAQELALRLAHGDRRRRQELLAEELRLPLRRLLAPSNELPGEPNQ
jgi:hypothetical protein